MMRHIASICFAVLVVGCADAQDEPDIATDSIPAPEPVVLAVTDVTGTWTVRVMPEGSDSVLLTYQLNAPADTSQWTMQFTDRAQAVPTHILAVAGDSIVTHAGPYQSALRQGVMVETHAVVRLQNGMLVGTAEARYKTTGADSVVVLRTEGTRVQ